MTGAAPPDHCSIVRGVGATRLVVGALLIARPDGAKRWIAGAGGPPMPAGFARVLGARMVVQAMAELTRPTRRVVLASAVVDGTHAFSMLVPFALDRRWRRAALVNAAASTVAAALLVREAGPTAANR